YTGEIGAKGTLKKSCLPPRWRLLMAQIMQCLGGKTCGQDQISNKDVTILYFLANGVQVDYAKIICDDLIHKLNKKTREKIIPYPSVHNLTLKPNQPEEPPFTNHMMAICNLVVHVDSKAPKPSLQTKKVPQGKKPGATTRLRSKITSKHTSESKTEASKSQTGQSKIKTQSSLAKDKSPSHPSPPTHVVGEMHKEAQQAASGHDVSTDSTVKADPGLSAPNDSIPPQQDKPINVSDESDQEEVEKAEETPATSQDAPEDTSSQKKELEQLKVAAKAEVASLKAKPSYPDINQLTTLLYVKDMELELPCDLKEIPSKLETFTSTISSLSSQVAKLKNIQWELPAEILDLPHLISSVQETFKTLDSLPGLLNKVTNSLNRFATMVENASEATNVNVPLAGKAIASPAEGEKHTKNADTNLKN
nr:hypothetical protein [Tanacetum cinerariifolium]